MTSIPQTSEISDNLSLDDGFPEAELLNHFGIHAVMTPEVAKLKFENLCSQTQPASGEPAAEENLLKKEASPGAGRPVIDMAALTVDQPSQPLAEECPKKAVAIGGDGACEPKSSAESEAEVETENLFKNLRRKLQNGLLIDGDQLKAEYMDAMSTCVKRLEEAENPPERIIRDTRMHTVLRKIIKLKEIPREDELHIQERATSLLTKWNNTFYPNKRAADPPTSQPLSQTASPPLVIDLTGLSDAEQSPQPPSHPGVKKRTNQSIQATAPPTSDDLASCNTIHNGQNSRTSSAPTAPKRKRSESVGSLPAVESSTPAAAVTTSPIDTTPTRRQKKQKTSFKKYISTENLWMNDSAKRVEKLLKLNVEEIELGKEKRKLHEKMRELDRKRGAMDREMRALDERMRELDERRGSELIGFKDDLSVWVKEDKKVTREWEQSE